MIKPDVIVTQPTQVDFPIFRYNMKKYREYFNKIIISLFKGAEDPNYTAFFKWSMKDMATILETPQEGGDWRNNTVNDMLNNSEADYVLFLEQDFLVRDRRLWEIVLNGVMDFNVITYDEGGRTHPAFALVPRELVDRTSKDFSANPHAGYDHFGKFFKELLPLSSNGDLTDLGLKKRDDFYHMAGLTNNYQRILENQPIYQELDFLAYNHYTRDLPIDFPPGFKEQAEQIENKYGHGAIYSVMEYFFPKKQQ
jgi:hypothetical protein